MGKSRHIIDVMHSPWCFIEAPEESYKAELARKWRVEVREFNLWEIEDADLPLLPEHIAAAIRRARTCDASETDWSGGGSLFFLDGQRLTLSPALKWPQVERLLASCNDEGR
jgi:hypothetical protein